MKKIIIKIVAILIIGGILCTTDLSLRTAVFFVSPHSAATMEYEHYKTESKWCELYKITKNPPYEDDSLSESSALKLQRF